MPTLNRVWEDICEVALKLGCTGREGAHCVEEERRGIGMQQTVPAGAGQSSACWKEGGGGAAACHGHKPGHFKDPGCHFWCDGNMLRSVEQENDMILFLRNLLLGKWCGSARMEWKEPSEEALAGIQQGGSWP